MASNAVVGILRAILTADTAHFDTSMRKASVTVGNFGKEIQKLTPQAERMAKAFGGEKLLASANNLTAAVAKIGGVLHSYSGGADKVERYAALGLHFSFAGPISFANARKPVEALRHE